MTFVINELFFKPCIPASQGEANGGYSWSVLDYKEGFSYGLRSVQQFYEGDRTLGGNMKDVDDGNQSVKPLRWLKGCVKTN